MSPKQAMKYSIFLVLDIKYLDAEGKLQVVHIFLAGECVVVLTNQKGAAEINVIYASPIG
jgi:hypothetical protein